MRLSFPIHDFFFFPALKPRKPLRVQILLQPEPQVGLGLHSPVPAVAVAGGGTRSQSSRLGWHGTGLQGSCVPCPGLLILLGGRERMNGLGCRAEKGREPWPDSLRLCAASLARPELFEAFCGCWLLLPPSLLSALSLSAQTGNLARILLPLHRQVWETVGLFRGCFERRGVHSDACAIHLTDPVLSWSGSFDGWYNEVIGFRHFESKRGSFWFLGCGKGTCCAESPHGPRRAGQQ